MARTVQRSFAGGEVSPALYGRADTVKWQTGLKTCRNFHVQRYGGVANRAGTQFVAEVKDSSKTVRLLKFVFNADQTYVLEFGDQYMRVHSYGIQLTDLSLTITNITQANPAVVTYTGTDPVSGEEVYISGVEGMTVLNGRNFKIANVVGAANTFELQSMSSVNIDSTLFTAYTSGGTAERVYELATPYVEADLAALQFVQSADVVTIVHPNYVPRDLIRSGHTSWTLSTITFTPTLSAPTNLVLTAGGGAGALAYRYKVTAVADETFEESLPSSAAEDTTAVSPTLAAPHVLTWTAVAGAAAYYVYRETYPESGVYAYIGTAAAVASPTFQDTGIVPDNDANPPEARDPFAAVGDYPSAVTYFQQRRVFGNTDNEPEKVWASRSGQYTNMTNSISLQDDDAVTFTIAGRQVNEVRHLVDLGGLLVFTSGAVWAAKGDADGVLKPTAINLVPQKYNGAADVMPVTIDNAVVYLQARGAIVREIKSNDQGVGSTSYTGRELSIFSPHLFETYQIVAWDYQEVPHSILWAVRDDGTLLGMTYIPEQEVWGWHRHDTDGGLFEDVACVPELDEDAVYVVVNRTIGGAEKRYIERFQSRRVSDIREAFFVDSGLSYDGRNTDIAHTMTLSGGVTWEFTEDLTLTSSTGYFTAADVGNAIVLFVGTTTLRCTILGYTSATEVTVQAERDVTASFQNTALWQWARAVDSFSGLYHLEGEELSVLADGNVEDPVTVASGVITLPRPYYIVHAGKAIEADFETLDIDGADSSELRPRKKLIKNIDLLVESSRGIWAGPDENNLREYKQRQLENWGDPTSMVTGMVEMALKTNWSKPGRVFVRQNDPLPLTILGIFPQGEIGE